MAPKKVKIYFFENTKEPRLKTLPEEVFNAKENPILMAQAVKVYLANQRSSKAIVKNRGEVSGSGKKIWRQKGTGRARHGDRYANIFVGGGVAHGPTGKENWHLNMPAKKKAAALAVCLSQKLRQGEIIFIDSLESLEGKTKKANEFLFNLLKKVVDFKNSQKIAVISAEKSQKLELALRNIPEVNLILVNFLNCYQVLENKFLIIEERAIEKLAQRLTHD